MVYRGAHESKVHVLASRKRKSTGKYQFVSVRGPPIDEDKWFTDYLFHYYKFIWGKLHQFFVPVCVLCQKNSLIREWTAFLHQSSSFAVSLHLVSRHVGGCLQRRDLVQHAVVWCLTEQSHQQGDTESCGTLSLNRWNQKDGSDHNTAVLK